MTVSLNQACRRSTLFNNDGVLKTSESALDTFSMMNDDGFLEPSAAALDTFSMMTVSLKQAHRHSKLFQR